MSNNLRNTLSKRTNANHAIASGTSMHQKLQFVFVDGDNTCGDTELVSTIIAHPELQIFFTKNSQTEIPLAGVVSGRFISRRIDRMIVNHTTKTIDVLDYKTDTDQDLFHDKYTKQIGEYIILLGQIYPGYKINGYILWTHNWDLEKIY